MLAEVFADILVRARYCLIMSEYECFTHKSCIGYLRTEFDL